MTSARRVVVPLVAFAALAVAAYVLPAFVSDFRAQQFAYVWIYLIALVGLNVLTGYTGQISLGHGAFMAVGGFTTAILMSDYGVKDIWTIPIAGLVAGVVGFLFGFPALRLSGLYLALATFAVAVATPGLIKRFEGFTGGGQGINLFGSEELTASLTPVSVLGQELSFNNWLYYLTATVALVLYVAAWLFLRGRTGGPFARCATARPPPSPSASASPATRRSPSGSAPPTRVSPGRCSRSRRRSSIRTPSPSRCRSTSWSAWSWAVSARWSGCWRARCSSSSCRSGRRTATA